MTFQNIGNVFSRLDVDDEIVYYSSSYLLLDSKWFPGKVLDR
ncbi:hypothetical protein Thini_1188 [Thiothrix nivea DSM 5205]|uniref:Uncharacterized protein n=1 Tax=Thiothrix nivea (strain ATCC 35100 / DSM 5205 / JP2) TaxID=870187 RepID=A0A656HEB1_THINJ|nr:hypothetical protein Thini_1188 [Thiothrix nivea DSM 5205]